MLSPNEHIVSSYEDELNHLTTNIAKMGGIAEQQLGQAIESIERRDPQLAKATIDHDKIMDRMERQIEELAIAMIARRQPMALDLRQVVTAIRISTDLERIGDLSKNIAKRAQAIVGESHPKPLILGLRNMGDLALSQLNQVLNAYSTRDAEEALKVWHKDEDLDATYNSLFRELLTYMMEDPRNISLCTHLLFGAKNIERIGDHATNIAETIFYLVHGTEIPEERPKNDTTSTSLLTDIS